MNFVGGKIILTGLKMIFVSGKIILAGVKVTFVGCENHFCRCQKKFLEV